MIDSVKEIELLLDLMGLSGEYPVLCGAERAMQDERTPSLSDGAEFIVREAMSDDQRPLFVIFLGAITDLATAYLMNPAIADRLTAVWIGGGAWPNGGWNTIWVTIFTQQISYSTLQFRFGRFLEMCTARCGSASLN